MGFGKERQKIKEKIPSWKCEGYFGYGHGRALREFGEGPLKNKSVCLEVCPKSDQCRSEHHRKMDERSPEIARIVSKVAAISQRLGRPVVKSVAAAMNVAEARKVPGTERIRKVLSGLRVVEMVDHYVCGQFENIQNGLDGVLPTAECSLLSETKKTA